MTYCIGLKLNRGLVFMSDTRTNAGLDNIASFKKMHTWEVPGDRVITLLTAGNLATTQAVISLLEERRKAPEDRNPSVLEAPSMFRIAGIVGEVLKDTISANANVGQKSDSSFNATLIVGGQIKGMPPRIFMVYPEGNFVEASEDTPFFQIGETKYGKPILVRAYDPDMGFEEAVKLLLVSYDSTIKSNLSVGLPLDVMTYETDTFVIGHQIRITEENPHYKAISDNWSDALREAFVSLPDFEF
tara:strand:- start:2034 stop:2765 length:732 start_codon:yes stop_codon:yes gene_type:complete